MTAHRNAAAGPVEVAATGATGGIVGGVAFAVGVREAGTLEAIAGLVRLDGSVAGLIVHLAVAATLGAAFSLLSRRSSSEEGSSLFWGAAYGVVWWLLGALTLLPLLRGDTVDWGVDVAQAQMPALIGHLIYGLVLGLWHQLFVARRFRSRSGRDGPVSVAMSVVVGVAIGSAVALVMLRVDGTIGSRSLWHPFFEGRAWASGIATLAVGVAMGALHGVLRPKAGGSFGPTLVRAFLLGFVGWVALAATVVPAVAVGSVAWTRPDVALLFPALVTFLLVFGVGIGFAHGAVLGLLRGLFGQDLRLDESEGVGARSLRAGVGGALAGVPGGMVFALVMAQLGFFSRVGGLAGSASVAVGAFVHLTIAVMIGASYGVLFRQRSFDVLSAIGWGVSYAIVWWIIGPLTFLPLLLDGAVTWTAADASAAFPGLVAHVAYGAFVGYVVHVFERRHNPWWIARTEVEQRRALLATEQLTRSAPAVWALVVAVAVMVPILVS